MDTKTTSKESGAEVKPGESTPVTELKEFTASSVEELLKSELATDAPEPETPPAPEIPAAGASDVTETETETVVEVLTDGQQAETKDEGESKSEDEGEKAPEETPLPEALQSELAAWEETGGALPAALQAVVGKRIGKLTGARDAEKLRADQAEAKLAAVTAEAEALRADPNRPATAVPVTVLDERVVTQYAATAQKMAAEIESYLDDSATDEERERVEKFMSSRGLDAKGLKRELRQTNQFLTQELPELKKQVQTFKQQEQTFEPVAKARFPWLDDKARPEYAKAQEMLGIMPELRQRTPAHKIALGANVLGLKVLEALNAAGIEGDALAALTPILAKSFPAKGTVAKPAVAKTPPPKAPVSGSAAPAKLKARPADMASQQFNKTPNRQTATEMARAALLAA